MYYIDNKYYKLNNIYSTLTNYNIILLLIIIKNIKFA